MARRRMYLFERAYLDFFARLRSLLRKLLAASRDVWDWFFRGTGSWVWEILVEIAVAGSAILLCVLLVRYESSVGRGFSVGSLVGLLIAFVYAFLLLWSWKAPVHFVAKALSAASAAGVVVILALAIALAAGAIFIPYLLLLFLLTFLSLAVFVPMRVAHWLWLEKRKITYKCPYDDCRFRGMPIHVCSCGMEYRDLQPNFYGIFHHACRHSENDIRLPTMDLWGRNKLPRLCGGCRRPLLHSSLGELREWPIFVMGGPNAGKSVLLAQAARLLPARLALTPGATVRLDSAEQQREHAEQLRLLDRGQVLAKTAGDVMTALGMTVRIPKGLRALVYLFDKPGEYFQSMKQFGRMQGIEGLRGILLVVDPFSLPGLEDYAIRVRGQLKPSEAPFKIVASNLIHAVENMLPESRQKRCAVPLALVLSKADAFPVQAYPFLANLVPSDYHNPNHALQARCREALRKLGAEDSVRMLEQKFQHVGYFACTALGRMPDLKDPSPFRPEGVVEPLVWLLDGATASSALAGGSARLETPSVGAMLMQYSDKAAPIDAGRVRRPA